MEKEHAKRINPAFFRFRWHVTGGSNVEHVYRTSQLQLFQNTTVNSLCGRALVEFEKITESEDSANKCKRCEALVMKRLKNEPGN